MAKSTDKNLLVKGIKFLFYTIFVMFLAPWVLFQAFKNQDHPFLYSGIDTWSPSRNPSYRTWFLQHQDFYQCLIRRKRA